MMTENQKYGMMNKRFDARAKFLIRLGWRYERTEFGFAIFKRNIRWRLQAIPASTVLYADNQSWRNELIRFLKRGMF